MIFAKGTAEMYRYRLEKLVFNDGTILAPGNLTVFIGPNNAGKSRALKDIVRIATRGTKGLSPSTKTVVVTEADWSLPDSLSDVRGAYEVDRYLNESGHWAFRTLSPELCQEQHFGTVGGVPDWYSWMAEQYRVSDRQRKKASFSEHFGPAMIAFLGTEQRLQLVKESDSSSQERQVANLLQSLYLRGQATEQEINTHVKRAFNLHVALDFTRLTRLQLRVGTDFSHVPPDPRAAREIMTDIDRLDEQGDGIRGFVGLVVALLAVGRSVFLIDEPEAFLHPPQAFRAGEFVAEAARENRQIIVATHSVDFLRGILAKTTDVTIIRLDRRRNAGLNNFCMLNPSELKNIVGDPLLSSARVLDGLFYPAALVVEGDSDARFYFAAAKRRNPELDLHVVNTDNKHLVPRMTSMYRHMGVRCAGIVDFDVLNKRQDLDRHLNELQFSAADARVVLAIREEIAKATQEKPLHARLQDIAARLAEILSNINGLESQRFSSPQDEIAEQTRLLRALDSRLSELADSTRSWSVLKKQGRRALSEELQRMFDDLWRRCAQQGLFINPCGELESTLEDYGVLWTNDKKRWITQALTLLPDLTVNDDKHPWALMSEVNKYLSMDALSDDDTPSSDGLLRVS